MSLTLRKYIVPSAGRFDPSGCATWEIRILSCRQLRVLTCMFEYIGILNVPTNLNKFLSTRGNIGQPGLDRTRRADPLLVRYKLVIKSYLGKKKLLPGRSVFKLA